MKNVIALNKRTGSLILLMLLVFGAAHSQSEKSLSKDEAVARALKNNLGIQIALKQGDLAQRGNTWGAAGALPVMSVSTTASSAVSDQSENPTAFIQDKLESESINSTVQLSWTIFDGMGMFANKRALETLELQAEGQSNLVVEQTIAAVLLAYDETSVQGLFLEVLKSSIGLAQERLNRLKMQEESGAASQFDRMQFENALWSDSLAFLQQELAGKSSMRNLNRLMGEREDVQWQLTTPLDLPESIGDWKSIENEVRLNATAIRNALIGRTLAQIGVDQATSRLYPVVGLASNFGEQLSQFSVGELSGAGRTLNVAANLSLNFNLFNGGATRRAIQQAKIQVDIAELSFQNQGQEVSRLLRNAYDRLESQRLGHRLSSQLTQNTKDALAIGEERFQFGAISSLEFRELQLNHQRAEVENLRSIQGWNAALTDLQVLRGTFAGEIRVN
ncbi:MAG: TolC family protein [Flavobacteriales bacterium]|nr:TolC family protein [Flavobacteriales bacterium]